MGKQQYRFGLSASSLWEKIKPSFFSPGCRQKGTVGHLPKKQPVALRWHFSSGDKGKQMYEKTNLYEIETSFIFYILDYNK